MGVFSFPNPVMPGWLKLAAVTLPSRGAHSEPGFHVPSTLSFHLRDDHESGKILSWLYAAKTPRLRGASWAPRRKRGSRARSQAPTSRSPCVSGGPPGSVNVRLGEPQFKKGLRGRPPPAASAAPEAETRGHSVKAGAEAANRRADISSDGLRRHGQLRS